LRESLRGLSQAQRTKLLASLPAEAAAALAYDWELHALDKQVEPKGDWVLWLVLAGRGFGKTRIGAEWIRKRVESGEAKRIILAGATSDDLRDIMVEGESGILATAPPWNRPVYIANKNQVLWPNGAVALCITADKPDRFRGKQADTFWADELAAWRYADQAWPMLQLGFRLGRNPRGIITTTPRPIAVVRDLLKRVGSDVAISRGTTYDNRANLAPAFFAQVVKQYENTRLGRQELYAEVLDDNPGALWKRASIDDARVIESPQLKRIVVAVDPAVTSNAASDETGIVVAGIGVDGHGYVLDDVSGIASPNDWAKRVIGAYRRWQADRVVAEVNNGGDLVEANIRTVDPLVSYREVRATRGKAVRAEPIAALYEQGRVHHVGTLAKLEDQMCEWDPALPGRSPDRLDALVWALTDLMLGDTYGPSIAIEIIDREQPFASGF
jgi:phage terminase large subunit-like protein